MLIYYVDLHYLNVSSYMMMCTSDINTKIYSNNLIYINVKNGVH